MDEANFSQVRFKLSSQELTSSINLNWEMWRVLSNIDGVHSVAEIAQKIGMDQATAVRIAGTLFQAGVLEIAPGPGLSPRPIVNEAFFTEITRELAKAMGPLASIIIDEKIAALGEKPESFPRDRLADLVEHVSEAIKDSDQRLIFQQLILETIRRW